MKENVTSTGEVEKDDEDSSVTRPPELLRSIFARVSRHIESPSRLFCPGKLGDFQGVQAEQVPQGAVRCAHVRTESQGHRQREGADGQAGRAGDISA